MWWRESGPRGEWGRRWSILRGGIQSGEFGCREGHGGQQTVSPCCHLCFPFIYDWWVMLFVSEYLQMGNSNLLQTKTNIWDLKESKPEKTNKTNEICISPKCSETIKTRKSLNWISIAKVHSCYDECKLQTTKNPFREKCWIPRFKQLQLVPLVKNINIYIYNKIK